MLTRLCVSDVLLVWSVVLTSISLISLCRVWSLLTVRSWGCSL